MCGGWSRVGSSKLTERQGGMNEKRMNQRVGDAVEEFTTKEKSKADRTDDLKRERKEGNDSEEDKDDDDDDDGEVEEKEAVEGEEMIEIQ